MLAVLPDCIAAMPQAAAAIAAALAAEISHSEHADKMRVKATTPNFHQA